MSQGEMFGGPSDDFLGFVGAMHYLQENPEGKLSTVLSWFYRERGAWFNSVKLNEIFQHKGAYFVGHNWARVVRQAAELKYIKSEKDPNQTNGTHRYRMP